VRGLDLARDLRAIRDPRRRLPAASQRFWDWLQQPSQQHSKTSFLRTLVHPSCLRSDRGTALARAQRETNSLFTFSSAMGTAARFDGFWKCGDPALKKDPRLH
jgi:hypothetical protein